MKRYILVLITTESAETELDPWRIQTDDIKATISDIFHVGYDIMINDADEIQTVVDSLLDTGQWDAEDGGRGIIMIDTHPGGAFHPDDGLDIDEEQRASWSES